MGDVSGSQAGAGDPQDGHCGGKSGLGVNTDNSTRPDSQTSRRFRRKSRKQKTYSTPPAPPPPISNASFLSKLFFQWSNYLVKGARRNTLQEKNLPQLEEDDKARTLLKKLEQAWREEEQRARNINAKEEGKLKKNSKGRTPEAKPSLLIAIMKTFATRYAVAVAMAVTESALKLGQAISLGFLLESMEKRQYYTAYGLAGGLALLSFSIALLHHHNFFRSMRVGSQAKNALIALVFEKMLRIPTSNTISAGMVVNLASNDVAKFEEGSPFYTWLVVAPLEITASLLYLYFVAGWPIFVGYVLLVFIVPIQRAMAKGFARFRDAVVRARDERIRFVSDLLLGIDVIKSSGWEELLSQQVSKYREGEQRNMIKSNRLRAMNDTLFYAFTTIISMVTWGTAWLAGRPVVASQVFAATAVFAQIQLTVFKFVPYAFEKFSETRVSVTRLEQLLGLKDLELPSDSIPYPKTTLQMDNPLSDRKVVLEIRDGNFSWANPRLVSRESLSEHGRITWWKKLLCCTSRTSQAQDGETPTTSGTLDLHEDETRKAALSDLSVSIPQGALIAVVGPVGSGKSSFIHAILGELHLISGTLRRSAGSVAYSSQIAWIIGGTAKENILMGTKYDKKRFDEVVRLCCLEDDFAMWEKGEDSLVGQRGITISGGQKARLSLARALYRNPDLLLLDDPLSAVDSKVARQLFQSIKSLNCTRVLVTHQIQFVRSCDLILVLENGRVSAFDTPSAILKNDFGFAKTLRDPLEQEHDRSTENSADVFRTPVSDGSLAEALSEVVPDPQLSSKWSGILSRSAGNGTDKRSATIASDPRSQQVSLPERAETGLSTEAVFATTEATEEEQGKGVIPANTYFEYIVKPHPVVLVASAFLFVLLGKALILSHALLFGYWVGQSVAEQQSSALFPSLLCGIMAAAVVCGYAGSFLVFLTLLKSAEAVCRKMTFSVLRCPMVFFRDNPQGRILNRFSKDQAIMDELTPFTFHEFLNTATYVAIIFVAVLWGVWFIAILTPFVGLWFFWTRRQYLRSSRLVKRMESASRSPVYSQLSETLDGLSSVRAFRGLAQIFEDRFFDAMDNNTRSLFAFQGLMRWVGVRLDLISTLVVTGVSFVAVVMSQFGDELISPGLAGVAISYAIQLLGLFQWTIRISSELEISFISVERGLEYTKLPPEPPLRGGPAPRLTWPEHGVLEMKNLSLKYDEDGLYVLDGVDIVVGRGKKAAIVGRTGAGKSSLINTVFRLYEPEGDIEIDGLSLKGLALHDFRPKIGIVPQQSFLFRGSLRFNLDPFGKAGDAQIWDALSSVGLKATVQQLPSRLDFHVQDNGKNFSVGERQLFCLARTVLMDQRIVIMDEATANVDYETDRLIQDGVRRLFKQRVVITIAHRLATIMDYDMVVVLDGGRVAEVGHPFELLQNRHGLFSSMVRETGERASCKLEEVARKSWTETRQDHAEVKGGDAE